MTDMAFDNTFISPVAPSAQRPPAHPTAAEIAALISELFAEGCLDWSQATIISAQPELHTLLDETMAAVQQPQASQP
jgi:hypothetical protein